ncbi:hypothetical protein [Bradyrhizobium diazoefficiens]
MTKQRVAPIEYDERAKQALDSCIAYLEEAETYVQGDTDSLPDPTPLLTARFPTSTILGATFEESAKDYQWPTISAKIVDRKAESARHFDPWYFVVMLLLELPGGRFIYDRSKKSQYFYAAYAGWNKKENFYLRRIVVDTPIWADTKEGKHRKGAHYDYRRATLHWICKDVVRTLGRKTRSTSSNREGAIRFAVALFRKQLAAHQGARILPGLKLTAAKYEQLLRIALHIADATQERYLLGLAGKTSVAGA